MHVFVNTFARACIVILVFFGKKNNIREIMTGMQALAKEFFLSIQEFLLSLQGFIYVDCQEERSGFNCFKRAFHSTLLLKEIISLT